MQRGSGDKKKHDTTYAVKVSCRRNQKNSSFKTSLIIMPLVAFADTLVCARPEEEDMDIIYLGGAPWGAR